MDETTAAAGAGAFVLASVHLSAGRLRLVERIPRSAWLSAAGGISVAYVFVHVLPELSRAQEALGEAVAPLALLERHAYLAALAGLAVFHGVDLASRRSRRRRRTRGEGDVTSGEVFWLSIATFAAYNALVGYLLLHRFDGGLAALAFFTFAMAVHFVVNDAGLREHHKGEYHSIGRWVLAAAAPLGFAAGLAVEVSEAALALLFAFLAGGVVLNVLKEELPEERDSRFSAFALGAGLYSAVLLAA